MSGYGMRQLWMQYDRGRKVDRLHRQYVAAGGEIPPSEFPDRSRWSTGTDAFLCSILSSLRQIDWELRLPQKSRTFPIRKDAYRVFRKSAVIGGWLHT
jgi:hypothetical protein